MSAAEAAVAIEGLSHRYGEREALKGVGFTVAPGEVFGLLGPNGSGKTTLFRILSTLIRPQSGSAKILGFDVAAQTAEVRRRIGVVFQAPSLDKKLTAAENLRHQGHLYGLRGAELEQRIGEMLARVGMAERKDELTEKLSGGQRRRVELAKGLLHRPQVLLLDEPSTGLDPGARRDLMRYLRELSTKDGVTTLLTTHLMEEAEDCARLAVFREGQRIALDSPAALKAQIGGDVVSIESDEAEALHSETKTKLGVEAAVLEGKLRVECEGGAAFVERFAQAFAGRFKTIQLGKPTLADVFLRITGHRFWEGEG